MVETAQQVPDPVALAQGHRLSRAARLLELLAWLGGAAVVPMACAEAIGHREVPLFIGLAFVALMLPWLRGPGRSFSTRPALTGGPRLPGEIHDLLAVVGSLIAALERGDDRVFHVELGELGRLLDDLGPEALRYLDERGADPARLRHGVCVSDPEADIGARFGAEQRRSLHCELVRFAAVVRGRPCGDPYRARTSEGPALLAAIRDPALARTRRRLFALALLLVGAWLATSYALAIRGSGTRVLCNPFGANPNCTLMPAPFDPEVALVVAVALVPMFCVFAAHVARRSAWRSWASALPGSSSPIAEPPRSRLARMFRRRRLRRLGGSLVIGFLVSAVVGSVTLGMPPVSMSLREWIIAIELVAFALVVGAALLDRCSRWTDRSSLALRVWWASGREALLTDLGQLRAELQASAPVRGELLEQLADALAEADALGRLSLAERDRVIVRLRAVAARDAAVEREDRDALALEVRCCEALIARNPRLRLAEAGA